MRKDMWMKGKMKEKKNFKRLVIFVIAAFMCISALSAILSVSADFNETNEMRLEASSYEIHDKDDGYQGINMDGFSTGNNPGNPDLPHKRFNILVHPDINFSTLQLQITSSKITHLEGVYNIKPGSPACTLMDGELVEEWDEGKNIVDGKNINVYENDEKYPSECISSPSPSQMRKWKFVEVDFTSFQYNPVSQELFLIKSISFELSYSRSGKDLPDKYQFDYTMDEYASKYFYNFDEGKDWYYNEPNLMFSPSHDYIIITTNAIESGSTELSNFVSHKQSWGHDVLVITEDNYGILTGQAPDGTAERIREWLKNNYLTEGIEYVLLIGDPDPDDPSDPSDSVGDVPMKMCWPRYGATYYPQYNESPTDYFYADLNGNWDWDGDIYFGEWGDDYGPLGGVDFSPEVYVGRIPVYGADYSTLDDILQKLMDYETDSGDVSWRKNVLLPMSFSDSSTDGASLSETMIDYYLSINGYIDWTMYQQGSADPIYNSSWTSDEELRGTGNDVGPGQECVKDRWSGSGSPVIPNDFGIVCWWAHGSATKAGVTEDGTLFSSSDCASLDDDHPSWTYQCSCNNGWPENSNNLGYQILVDGGIGTVSASRVSWYWVGETYGEFDGSDSNAGIGYEYIKRLSAQELEGAKALYQAKNSMTPSCNEMLMNWYDFNLYGDPALNIFPYPDTVYVDDDYTPSSCGGHTWSYDAFDNIQDGIDAVAENGTVYVYNGTYYENVVVNKTLNLLGEDKNITIIDGSGSGDVLNISADWTNISGFKIQNSGSSENDAGIALYNVQNCSIANNACLNNNHGINLHESNNNYFVNITVASNQGYGCKMHNSNHNALICWAVTSNLMGGFAVKCDDNLIKNTSIDCGGLGGIGVNVSGATNLTIDNTDITNCTYGILLKENASDCVVNNSRISTNTIGIYLDQFTNTNTIYNNYFNNTENAYDYGTNTYNISKTIGTNIIGGPYLGGNNWSDYTGVDNTGDGIGDTNLPYNSFGNIQIGGDLLPLVEIAPDINPPEITNVTAAPNPQKIDGYVNITCDVTDDGTVDEVRVNITYPDTFSHNYTMDEGSYYYNQSYAQIGIYEYFIWANDTYGNKNTSSVYTFEIKDMTPPKITNVSATPSSTSQGGNINITCSVTDNIDVDTVNVSITGPDGFDPVNTTMNEGSHYYNRSYDIEGTYEYFIWANDTSGNANTSAVYTFDIWNITPPEITNVTLTTSNPLDIFIGWENFSCTATDNIGVDEVKLVLTGDTTTEYPMTNAGGDNYYCNITIPTADEYTYHIWANDTNRNYNTSIPQPFDLPLNEDVDVSGKVHFMDLVAVARRYNDEPPNGWIGEPPNGGWIREDVDNSGKVHFMDLIAIARQYNEEWK